MSLTLKSVGFGNQAVAAVSKLRRQRREEQLRAYPGWQERVKGIDHQIEQVMRETNKLALVSAQTK